MKKNVSRRMIAVLIFIVIIAIGIYINLRGEYLEYLEIGEKYIGIFKTNLSLKINVMSVSFIAIYILMYITNKSIKKGLIPFFNEEKVEMPKLFNKSISFVTAVIASMILTNVFADKVIMFMANTSFGINDLIHGMDISYFMFQKPLIEAVIITLLTLAILLTIYTAIYYVSVFNICFDGVDGKLVKKSKLVKTFYKNISIISVLIAILIVIKNQNIVFGNILKIGDNVQITGAGITESTIQLWGYIIFSILIVVVSSIAIKRFKKGDIVKGLKAVVILPAYLVSLFVVMIVFDITYAKSNELDKEEKYLIQNIKSTKEAYGIEIEQKVVENTGSITSKDIDDNINIINNIPIIKKDTVIKTLEDSQTSTGYYSFRTVGVGNYEVNGNNKLMYISPKEIKTEGRTYEDRTFEYTHGNGIVVTSTTKTNELGNIEYLDSPINISNPRIYFGVENDNTVVTNTKDVYEYDKTDENGRDITYTYSGKAGINISKLDKMILAIKNFDINILTSSKISKESKILLNTNILDRVKKILPNLKYDQNPYMVISQEGKLVWVIDGYTYADSYPYSNYVEIETETLPKEINYIRNSCKVLVDAYDGTVKYYITDRTDPIIMAYSKMYKELFVTDEIPQDIAKHFVYPKYLYDIQSEILEIYHAVKPDVLYRGDDIWNKVKYNKTTTTSATGIELPSYYALIKKDTIEQIGLIQMYTPNEKKNLSSYLVGTVENGKNVLSLNVFDSKKNVLGPMQLEKQIAEDEKISKEIETLNISGTKVTKDLIIIPINNTFLYVEPIYQTMLNEVNMQAPILKKVILSSENKIAIGNNLTQALQNLLSKNAIDFEIEDTETIDGLIDAIIKANINFKESTDNKNFELMGKDIKTLQELIEKLEKLQKENKENEEKLESLVE